MTWERAASGLDPESVGVNVLCGKEGEMEPMNSGVEEHLQN